MAARGDKTDCNGSVTDCYSASLSAGIERELEELNRQIEMEMAVYSGMEYIAGKTEKD